MHEIQLQEIALGPAGHANSPRKSSCTTVAGLLPDNLKCPWHQSLLATVSNYAPTRGAVEEKPETLVSIKRVSRGARLKLNQRFGRCPPSSIAEGKQGGLKSRGCRGEARKNRNEARKEVVVNARGNSSRKSDV